MGNWSELPKDLLFQISGRLPIPDLLCFEAVCLSWAAVIRERRRRYHPPSPYQSPWLMFSASTSGTAGKGKLSNPTAANFYSPSDGRTYKIDLPNKAVIGRGMWIGSGHGWIIFADNRSELFLLNPITGQQIPLPPVATFKHVEPVYNSKGKITKYLLDPLSFDVDLFSGKVRGRTPKHVRTPENLRFMLYRKAVLSSSPTAGGDYYVMLILYQPFYAVAFANSGDHSWTLVPLPYRSTGFADIACHDGRFYTTRRNGIVECWEPPRPRGRLLPERVLDSPEHDDRRWYFFYLVSAPWGELLQVWRLRARGDRARGHSGNFETQSVQVFRVDFGTQKLVPVDSLGGDHAIFLGCNVSACVSTRDVPGLKPDCVYVTDDHWEIMVHNRDSWREVGVFNLKDGSMEPILPEDPRLSWPPPIWVIPCLT